MTYYLAHGNQQRGPFTMADLPAQGLTAQTLVWRAGMPQWLPAAAMPELAGLLAGPVTVPAAGPVFQPGGQLSYASAMSPTAQPSGMAITSMVLGIVSLACMLGMHIGMFVTMPSAILAITFGVVARGKARRGEAGGMGMATAGLICGSISLGLTAAVIIVVVAFFTAMLA